MAQDPSEFEELFRPQIQGRSRHAYRYDRPGGRRSLLAQLRTSPKRDSAAPGGAGRARYDVGETPENSRRCVVKSHYVSMARGGLLAATRHLAYLERDGVERDGTPGRLFGAGEAFNREALETIIEKRRIAIMASAGVRGI